MTTDHQEPAPIDDDVVTGVAAELGRLIDSRWWWVLLAVTAAASALVVLARLVLARQALDAMVPLEAYEGAHVLVTGNGVARLFAMVAGVVVARPVRSRPSAAPVAPARPAARVAAAFVTGVAHAIAALLVGLVGTVVAWSFLAVPFAVTGRVVAMVAAHLLAVGLWGLMGLGIGLLFRNPVIAVVVAVVAFHVLPLVLSLVPWWQAVAGWVAVMPWGATRRLLDLVRPDRSLAGAGAALAILCGWAIILLGAGVMRYRTPDDEATRR